MEFRWNSSFSKNWSWQAGSKSGGSAERRVRAGMPVREKLIVRAPLGALRVTGASISEVEIKIGAAGRTREEVAGVGCRAVDRAGETELSIDVPFASDPAAAGVELRVPYDVALELHCGTGAVEVLDVRGTCDVFANGGAVLVRLDPRWHGERITIGTNLGPATLEVPPGVRLHCVATSTVGAAESTVVSTDGAPLAKVHCNIGAARIIAR